MAGASEVEEQAFLFLHELEDVIRDWIASVYHRASMTGWWWPSGRSCRCRRTRCSRSGWRRPGGCGIPATPGAGVRVPSGGMAHHPALRGRGRRAALQRRRRWNGYRNATSPLRRCRGREVADPGQRGRRAVRLLPGPGRRPLAPAGLGARRDAGHAVLGRGRPRTPADWRRGEDRLADPRRALAGVLARWRVGQVTGGASGGWRRGWRAERRGLPASGTAGCQTPTQTGPGCGRRAGVADGGIAEGVAATTIWRPSETR